MVRERRTGALQLLDRVCKYLSWQVWDSCLTVDVTWHFHFIHPDPKPFAYPPLQAEDWNAFSTSLGDWLLSVVVLHEEYKVKTTAAEAEVRATLKARRDEYNAEDAAREDALERAVAAVGEVSEGAQRLFTRQPMATFQYP